MTATCTTTRGIPYQVIKASCEKLRKDLCWERIRKQRSQLEFLCLKFHFAFLCLSSVRFKWSRRWLKVLMAPWLRRNECCETFFMFLNGLQLMSRKEAIASSSEKEVQQLQYSWTIHWTSQLLWLGRINVRTSNSHFPGQFAGFAGIMMQWPEGFQLLPSSFHVQLPAFVIFFRGQCSKRSIKWEIRTCSLCRCRCLVQHLLHWIPGWEHVEATPGCL